MTTTGVALVGCGYAADLYQATWANHPSLRVTGVHDRDPARLAAFAGKWGHRSYASLDDLLADPEVSIVANVTTPQSHAEVSRAALAAGKHVYSEKPLATDLDEARELVRLAESAGLQISSAPCGLLGETAQTLGRQLRAQRIGKVYTAYAELDDGVVHRMAHETWRSPSGAPWPARNEFATGCTLEHAGYYLSWLVAFFGTVRRVTAVAATLERAKLPGVPPEENAPDLTIGLLEHESGVVSRLTTSVVGPRNHKLLISGERGALSTRDCWDFFSPVTLHRPVRGRHLPLPVKLLHRKKFQAPWTNRMDFARGVAELAEAVEQGRPSRLSAQLSLHVTEVTLALQRPDAMGSPYLTGTTAPAVRPMPWAE